jgi:hypothetical protein
MTLTPWTESFICKAKLIGNFNINGHDMRFDTNFRNSSRQIDRSFFINDLGPVVYIMVCANTGELIKIGKAAGNGNFYSRMGTYNTGYSGDKTNARIIRYMNSINQNKILVYAIQTPDKPRQVEDKKNNCYVTFYSETASDFEKLWTREARESGEALNGSTQK